MCGFNPLVLLNIVKEQLYLDLHLSIGAGHRVHPCLTCLFKSLYIFLNASMLSNSECI